MRSNYASFSKSTIPRVTLIITRVVLVGLSASSDREQIHNILGNNPNHNIFVVSYTVAKQYCKKYKYTNVHEFLRTYIQNGICPPTWTVRTVRHPDDPDHSRTDSISFQFHYLRSQLKISKVQIILVETVNTEIRFNRFKPVQTNGSNRTRVRRTTVRTAYNSLHVT